MSRSRNKYAAGTNVVCKSQKKGKQFSSRKFRAMERAAIRNGSEPPYKQIESTDPWDLGGDGKRIYGFGAEYDRWKRK
ncbi:MAG: hypothetical protein IJ551_09345 [Prevotella sp.]|nr:hypothetical protein [Prevotella sp.]